MPITSAMLRAMFASGVSHDAIIAVAEAEEAADREREREKLKDKRYANKIYKREQRTRDAIATGAAVPLFNVPSAAADVPPNVRPDIDVRPDTPSSSSSPTPPLITPSPVVVGDVVGARAGEISEQAFALAGQVFAAMGIDPAFIPPGWCGTAMYLQGWLNDGKRPQLILLAAQECAASLRKRGAPLPHRYRYLTNFIVQTHEEHERQLTMVGGVVSNPEKSHGATARRAGANRPGGFARMLLAHATRDDAGVDPDHGQVETSGTLRSTG